MVIVIILLGPPVADVMTFPAVIVMQTVSMAFYSTYTQDIFHRITSFIPSVSVLEIPFLFCQHKDCTAATGSDWKLHRSQFDVTACLG